MPITIYPTNLKYKNSNGQFQSATAIKGDSGAGIVEQVNGTAPTIVCEDNHRYICGEVLSLNITPPANGACEIIFESGSTATLLTAPNTIKWPEWFNPNSLETSATYQFKISNGLANVAIWPDEGLTGDTRVRIQKMLGIYEAPWELIREDTFTNEEEADHIITVDSNGQSFELTDAIMMFETPKQDQVAKKMSWGQIWFYYTNSSYFAPEPGQWTQEAGAAARGFIMYIHQNNGLVFVERSSQTATSNTGAVGWRYMSGLTGYSNGIFMPKESITINKINIRLVTGTGHYILYGKRKWQ